MIVLFGFASYYSDFMIFLFLFLLKQYGVHRFQIFCDKQTTRPLIRKIEEECTSTETSLTRGFKKVKSGWIWSKRLIGCITYDDCGDLKTMTLITSSLTFEELIKPVEEQMITDEPSKQPREIRNIYKFYRYGSYERFYYSRVLLNITSMNPTKEQAKIIKSISAVFAKKKQCTVFIEGPPCTGKSSIGYLVAKELSGSFCNTFNPTEPGDTINMAITSMHEWVIDEDKPIIISIDEIDVLLKKINENTVIINQKIPTSVTDKQSWSKFMDDLQFYKNLIFIMTSNTSKTDIDNLDPALIRPGRVDEYHTLDVPYIIS
jgi:hypothetical protein